MVPGIGVIIITKGPPEWLVWVKIVTETLSGRELYVDFSPSFLYEYPTHLKHHIVCVQAHIITVPMYQKVYLLVNTSLQPSIEIYD